MLAYEAPRLFVERARSARPNFTLDEAMAVHVRAICQRLDGIPLAIELAAARIRTVPVDRLARDLDDAFRVLTGGSRTAMARQQTLLASIAWSVDLLDDVERAVLRRLAVFLGPFTLEAAELVAADGELVTLYDVLDLVSRLVDKSLVLFDDTTGRYRLLETIRQFSLDRLRDARELTEHTGPARRVVRGLVRVARPRRARLRHRSVPSHPSRRVRRPRLGLRARPDTSPTA